MVAFVLLMSLRLALDPLARSWTLILAVLAPTVLLAVVICVVVFRVYNRKLGRLAVLAGPGGWGTPCVDPDDPQSWMALLVDDEGIRFVTRSGDVYRHWGWGNIRDVTVERFPVALGTSVGVVLHLDDGSVADLLLPGRTHLRYSRPRAEAAAKDIRARLDAFRARSDARGDRAGPASDSHGRPLRVNHSDGP